MSDDLEVRRAEPEELETVVDILSECARWLLGRGIRQWPDPFPARRVAELLEEGAFYLARLDGEVVATFALLWSDPVFWGEGPPDAAYLHAVAVRRDYARRGVGRRLIEWAADEAAAAGREYLRLDCLSDNAALRAYYETLGFVPQGDVAIDDFEATLSERPCRA